MLSLVSPALGSTHVLASSQHMSLSENISFQLTGLAVVFIALGAIWMVLTVTGSFFKRFVPVPTAKAALPVAAAAPVAATIPDATLDPAIFAVIAVAVHVSLGSKARVHKIITLGGETDWAREGRRQIFTSHKVR